MKPIQEAVASGRSAMSLLAMGHPVSDWAFRDQFIKALTGGRVTNYELMTQTGDKSLAERAKQYVNTITDGTFTPKNRAEYQEVLRVIQEANEHEAALRLAHQKRIGLESYGLTAEQVDPIVSGYDTSSLSPAKVKAIGVKSQKAVANPPPNPGAPAPAVKAGTIRMRAPGGGTGTVSAARKDEFIKKGYVVLPGAS